MRHHLEGLGLIEEKGGCDASKQAIRVALNTPAML